jgi:hypothetical protein
MKKYSPLVLLLLSAALAHGQQMAVTFDDRPAHGKTPAGITRLEIVQSILALAKINQFM